MKMTAKNVCGTSVFERITKIGARPETKATGAFTNIDVVYFCGNDPGMCSDNDK